MPFLARQWLIWAATTIALALYVGAMEIESYTADLDLRLRPGTEIETDIFRLYENELRMTMVFRSEGCELRPELGSTVGTPRNGSIKMQPGAMVRVEASLDGAPPVTFEAMPVSSHCNGNLRVMTTNLSTAPGTYPWPPPPTIPRPMLQTGYNHLKVKVTTADVPISGERVRLYVLGSLNLKTALPNVEWLWQAFLVELVAPVTQSIWALVLVFLTVRAFLRRRRG